MNVSDILEKAADLIEPEGAWVQGDYAQDAAGNRLYNNGSRAVCWCAAGAIDRALGSDLFQETEDWIDSHAQAVLGMDSIHLETWNDAPERTQAEVVAKLREAAALARQEGK